MNHSNIKKRILIAENDDKDFLLIQSACEELGLTNYLDRVKNGLELMSYLDNTKIKPSLILLDLNMPHKDGRECLVEIKSKEAYKEIPVVVLTTSSLEKDVRFSYLNGANTFIRKPASFSDLTDCIKLINEYWLKLAILPNI